jgi:glyoxylase-like metal-dependent hydrolase (beta-lactamase superfamily II)
MNAPASLPPRYEVLAFKYATRHGTRSHFFLGGDPHDTPQALDYYVWSIRGEGRTMLVDTGFTAEMSRKRGRDFLVAPELALARAGIDPAEVTDVVLTHLHYDHAGNLDKFPNATFHVQDDEMRFATGRYMCSACQRKPYEVDDVVQLLRLVYKERVKFHKGRGNVADGVELWRIGGHTDGLQSVRVHTGRGWIALASDATHLYENFEARRPFPLVFNVGEMLDGYDILREMADSDEHIVPGHDPLVMQIYPPYSPALADQVVRLDRAPTKKEVKA